jgi:hypothetical protein
VPITFEYQYHRDGGLRKLNDDQKVDHIFISYEANYRNVEVRFIRGAVLAPFFEIWRPAFIENYSQRSAQRFRKNIRWGYVKEHGQMILRIADGQLADLGYSQQSLLTG